MKFHLLNLCIAFQVLWWCTVECVLLHHPDADLSIQQIIRKYGYPVEDHYIVTADGYILNYQRIPYGRTSYNGTRKPILLMHGLMGSADNYIFVGPDKAFAYKFADRGYDVWMGNARGSMHSRNHTKYNPNTDKRYWDFSYHEIGTQDIPAAIDYILNVTKHESLYYIGHSQGTTTFLIMLADRPEYNKKVTAAALMAPAVFIKGMKNPFLPPLAMVHTMLQDVLKLLNIHEIIPNMQVLRAIGMNMCQTSSRFSELCENLLFLVDGWNGAQFNRSEISLYLSKVPAGCSVRQPLHYAQVVTTGKFRHYDFGRQKNMELYKTPTPPDYNLSNVVIPIGIFRGKNDWLVPEKGLNKLKRKLPNVAVDHYVDDKYFTHVDFIIAMNVVEKVYNPVVKFLESYGSHT